jgi:methyl-accepting chemotaxis protein
MNFLNKMSVNRKLLVMMMTLAAPSLWLTWQLISLQSETIDVAQLELQGVKYVQGLEELAGPVADRRGLMTMFLAGDTSRADAIRHAESQADAAFAVLMPLETVSDSALQTQGKLAELQAAWQLLVTDGSRMSNEDNLRRHGELLEKIAALNERQVDTSKLALDPEETSYYLMSAAAMQLPSMQRDIFELRSAALSASQQTTLSKQQHSQLSGRIERVRSNAQTITKAVQKLSRLLPSSETAMQKAVAEHTGAAIMFASAVEDGLIISEQPRPIGSTAFMLGSKAYETTGGLRNVLIPLLQNELNNRVARGQWSRNLTLMGVALLLAIAIVVGRVTRLNVSGGARATVKAIDRLANGDIGHEVNAESEDEFGQVLRSVAKLDRMLVNVVATVRTTADTVGEAAQELAIGNEDLSGRTQQQAASIEETAASMEQMTATVKQNAESANRANKLVAGARSHAERGGAVVERAVVAMNEINASSRKIADIISVIDAIAFQTNLLALNAAVEAARAGEQGRGFAVVATEVRNLAQRSASAAKEIKALINDSVDKVQAGTKLVHESGASLQEIMDSVRQATDLVADIASASNEQSAGIEQVNQAIATMDSSTQQNAALVEQSTAVSKTIHSTASKLVEQIAFFKVQPSEQAHTSVRRLEPRASRPVTEPVAVERAA